MQYTLEYVMCYKESFILGVTTGLLIATLFIKRKRNAFKQ